MENKFASRTYGFPVNFRIRTIYLPRTWLLSTIKIMLLPTLMLLPTIKIMLLPTVHGKNFASANIKNYSVSLKNKRLGRWPRLIFLARLNKSLYLTSNKYFILKSIRHRPIVYTSFALYTNPPHAQLPTYNIIGEMFEYI